MTVWRIVIRPAVFQHSVQRINFPNSTFQASWPSGLPLPIRAQECPAKSQAHRDLYIYGPLWCPFMFNVPFCCHTYSVLAASVHDKHLSSVLFGARYVWDHLYRTPHSNTHASYCVWCFWLETGGEHPFAVSFFIILTWFVPPSWPTFMLFTCLLPVPASSKLCMWMATTLLVFDPNFYIYLFHTVC